MLTASDSSGTIKKEDAQSRVTKYRDFYGKIIQFKYDTYGKVIKRTGTTNTPFQYNGRDGVMTDENGLLYMRSRYYSPELKRFLNADIVKGDVSHSATLNQYAYVNGNPISYVDPFGTSADQGSGTQNYEKVIDYLQTALDIIGFIPGYGDIADLINALIYAVRGDWANAGLSALAIIPMLGSLGTGTKLGGKALGKLDDVWALLKNNDGFADLGKLLGKHADDVADLHRPYIRKGVRADVEFNAPKTIDGKFIDPNTGVVIEGKYDLGHKAGNEFWREKAKAQSEGLTQKQFNDRMNNPDYYQIENPSSNRGHWFEKR